MSFPSTVCIPILLSPVLENNSTKEGRMIRINSIRVSCKELINYKVWLYLLDGESPLDPMLLSYDELSAGDYFIDDTIYTLPSGYKILAQTDVPGKVFMLINGEEI